MNKQSTWKKNLHKRKGQKGKDKSAKLMQLSPEQRKERFLSRQKQIEIAKSRGTEHFGPQIKK